MKAQIIRSMMLEDHRPLNIFAVSVDYLAFDELGIAVRLVNGAVQIAAIPATGEKIKTVDVPDYLVNKIKAVMQAKCELDSLNEQFKALLC